MADAHAVRSLSDDGDDVESQLLCADLGVFDEPSCGEPVDASGLAVRHRLGWIAELCRGACLDLDEDDGRAVPSHDVEFTVRASPVSFQHDQTRFSQVRRSDPLAEATDFILYPHAATVHAETGGALGSSTGCGRYRALWTTLPVNVGGAGYAPKPALSPGNSSSGLSSSSMLTSLKVNTRTVFAKRAGRYMSHTQASRMVTSK